MYRFVDKVLCSTHDEGELREKIRDTATARTVTRRSRRSPW